MRTPNFKKWFGDWEAVATAKSIRDLAPVDATNAKEVVTKKDIENYFRNNSAATNALNGVTASFPVATAGKLYHHKGFPVGRIVGRLKEIFEQSVPFLSEKEVLKEGHKAHPNIDSFDHYVGKVSLGSGAESGEYYVRFTVRKEVAGKKGNIPRQETHNVAVSDVQIYEKPATTNLSGNTPEEGSHPAFVDSKLRDFFAKVNPSSVSKVVDPETGEPLVVYHGTSKRDAILDGGFKQGWIHLTDSRAVADSYQAWVRDGKVTPGTLDLYVKANNPAYYDAGGQKYTEIGHRIFRATADAERSGHDALIVKSVRDNYDSSVPTAPHTTVVAFSPTQIKSTTNNSGEFDSDNPDIRFSRKLLAPNGKPSNLTPEQHAEVRTPEFKAWAGDWEAVAGQEMERKKGETALDALLQNKTGEVEAMSRPGLGQVVFIYGTPGRLNTKGRLVGGGGVAHMIEQRNLEGKDGEFIARKMPEVIAHGEVTAIQGEGTSGERVRIVHDGHTAVLSLYQNGSRKTWLLSGWENEGGGAGVNPATAYASDGSGISRQKGASSDKRISLNARVVKPSSISVRLDKNGEPLVRDGQYENSRTGEKRDVGSFVPDAPTRFKRSAPAAKTTPKAAGKPGSFEHIFDRMRVLFQDRFLPVKRVQELLQSQGWKMDPDADAYLAEERYYGRAGYRLEKFQEDHVAPLMEKIKKSDLSIAELEEYLYAKYAPQRNAHIASINPKMPDGGSGRTNKWAKETLARFEQEGKTTKLEELARGVRAITKMQRDTIRKEGLEVDDVIDAWEMANPDYVPLKGKDDDGAPRRGIGTGFNVKGSGTKRALGRSTPATDILANLIAQTGDTLVRAEKARVGRAFYRMVEENPDADRWVVHEQLPSRRAMVNGQVRNVTDFSFPQEDNVITVTLPEGSVRYIEIFDKDLAAAMKNVGGDQAMSMVTQKMAAFTRYLSTVSTSLNPVFVVTNFQRDLLMAMIALAGERSIGFAATAAKNVPSAMRGIYNYLRGDKKHEWAKWFEMYKASGAQVSFMDLRGVDQIARDLKLMAAGEEGYVATTKAQFANVLRYINDVNSTVENAVRLASFRAAVESGASIYDAASMAKNLTVNFNRKGQLGPLINSWYMFFNAGVQGSARILSSNREMDFARENAAANLVSTPDGYTWHHHQDSGYMQLIPSDIYDAVRHSGDIAILKCGKQRG